MKRTFLGWDEPVLAHTAKWLLKNYPDLSNVKVVVRGGRAGRRLLEKLAIEADRQKIPLFSPRISTIAKIAEELFDPPAELGPAASELTQKLAWVEALRLLPQKRKAALLEIPLEIQQQGGFRPELLLAGRVQSLWNELGGEGLTFAGVAEVMETKMPEAPEAEVSRWTILEEAHKIYREVLKGGGWMDPAERRTALWMKGTPRDVEVVLAGVVEIRPVFVQMLARLPRPAQVLVFAPEAEAAGFDDLGQLEAKVWAKRSAGLRDGEIHPVGRAVEQSARLTEMARAWPGMALAIPDETAVAGIREHLHEVGLDSHWAEGRKMEEGRVAGFLRAVAEYVSRNPGEAPSWESGAWLARHPDGLGSWIHASRVLDEYAAKHVPERMDPPQESEAGSIAQKLAERIGLTPEAETATRQAEKVTAMLSNIYGTMEVVLDSPTGRMMNNSLKLLRKVLGELSTLRLPCLEKIRMGDFLRLVLGEMDGERVPESFRRGAVEMVGWLELVEEDAPAVAVASFHEGAVPKSVTADEFLPGHLREVLGCNDNTKRLARDAYALAVVRGTRAEGRGIVGLVVPAFNPSGDPVKPSRLLLCGLQGEELAARVVALTERKDPLEKRNEGKAGPGFGALAAGKETIEKISVTAFRDYLMSPRYFYFRHVLKLREVEDEPGDLTPGGFGSLIHQVVGGFGRDLAIRESTKEEEIRDFLRAELAQISKATFGARPRAAVAWQIEQAELRLDALARIQAKERMAGWKIVLAEEERRTGAGGRAVFDLKDPQGRILRVEGRPDRIERNEKTGFWRIVDLKTKSTPEGVDRAHQKADGTWKDLQMPLYRELAPILLEGQMDERTPHPCELVYLQLPKDTEKAGISEPMSESIVQDAMVEAGRVAGLILDANWEEIGELDPETTGATFLALCGQAGIPREEEEEDGDS